MASSASAHRHRWRSPSQETSHTSRTADRHRLHDTDSRRRHYSSSSEDDQERRRRGDDRRKDENIRARPRRKSRDRKADDYHGRRHRSISPAEREQPRKRRRSRSRSRSKSRDSDRRWRRKSRSRDRSGDYHKEGRRRHRDSNPRSTSPPSRRRAASPANGHTRRSQRRSRSPTSSRRPRSHSRSRSPPRKRRRKSNSPSPPPAPRSRAALPDQATAFHHETPGAPAPPPEKQKPNLNPTGLLAKETNTVSIGGASIVLKYNEPSDARKPSASTPWRLYVFKGRDILDTIPLHTRSCWLIGREERVADLCVRHPSTSGQHAAIQFRQTVRVDEWGERDVRVRPYVIDLESSNGTMLNGERVEATRFVELRDGDVLRFGESEREYVVMLPPADKKG
ncbi:hypothetical protein W97_04443 [Coniosporium apollinis CBS 100218]|uniref:FHA domain-containing protein n=1 Tax=Coniosporium apollinis (strain CBS 100218) TaxID=1168221 RepID=R7YU67_CONA1|nr:uncharacterized protein W97_04443 [Coniosporium apollinis CBS 100218]EON65206.1 hypothetical protein W97_04443 [Coniosporium apollinis CBS 100218]